MPEAAATLTLAALGLSCVFAGYRLFCGLPALNRNYRTPRLAAFTMNILPGALLALFGAGLFTTETKTFLTGRPTIQRHFHATQPTGWPHSNAHIPSRAA